jgi:hypothetical protein
MRLSYKQLETIIFGQKMEYGKVLKNIFQLVELV